MEAEVHSNLTGIAVVTLAALTCGLILQRLRQPAIVGYLQAGAISGPPGFAIVGRGTEINTLAELGVLLLLFAIGMELSLRAFRRMWRLFLVATALQIGASTGVMLVLSTLFDWPLGLSVLLGFVVAISSTAVAIKVLEDLGELRTHTGRVTVGVLIAQDLAVVPMMLTIGALAEGGFHWFEPIRIVLSVAFLAWLIWFLSRGRKIHLPFSHWVGGHAELTPIATLVFCFGAAALSGLVGLSAAYGAFLAGLVIGNSHERQALIAVTKPIQSILMMVFFLSIGLLIDLGYLWRNLGQVMMLLFVVTVFKTALNVGILRVLGQPWPRAFLAGVMLAQIGEFSFLLALVGIDNGLIGPEYGRLVVAVTVLSLSLSPVWVVTARRLKDLAAAGITEGAELLRLVYGPEAEKVAETVGEARLRSRRLARWLRLLVLLRRRRRLREAQAAAKEPQEPTVPAITPVADEIPAPAETPQSPAKDGGDA